MKSNAIAQYITKPGMRTNSFMEPRNKKDRYWEDDIIDQMAETKITILRYNKATNKYDYVEVDVSDDD